jgi:cysteine desulfurase family protein
MSRIYLDNAATSWPKPETVYRAVEHAIRELGSSAGRGVYRESITAMQMIEETRIAILRLINGTDANQIILTSNGTESLNIALHGSLTAGDHVICTAIDHNSVLRPLKLLEKTRGVEVTRVKCDEFGRVDLADIQNAWRKNTRLVAISHVSNVTGTIQEIARLGEFVRGREGVFLVDAAQTLGHVPIDVQALNIDLLAAPGHKGLLGPLGTGVLYVGDRCRDAIRPMIVGGTGTDSDQDEQPWSLPHRLESGNLNVPAIAGLLAGVKWIAEQGVLALQYHEQELNRTWNKLIEDAGLNDRLQVYGPMDPTAKVGLVSLNVNDLDASELAMILDQQMPRVQGRAGLHCAPLIHEFLGSKSRGGTFRLSWGPLTTEKELTSAVDALKQIVS